MDDERLRPPWPRQRQSRRPYSPRLQRDAVIEIDQGERGGRGIVARVLAGRSTVANDGAGAVRRSVMAPLLAAPGLSRRSRSRSL